MFNDSGYSLPGGPRARCWLSALDAPSCPGPQTLPPGVSGGGSHSQCARVARPGVCLWEPLCSHCAVRSASRAGGKAGLFPPPVPGAPKKGINARPPPAFPGGAAAGATGEDLPGLAMAQVPEPRICTRPVSLLPARRPCRHVVLDAGALHRPPQEANAIRLFPSLPWERNRRAGTGLQGPVCACACVGVYVHACLG